jgi:hypothetical protein
MIRIKAVALLDAAVAGGDWAVIAGCASATHNRFSDR